MSTKISNIVNNLRQPIDQEWHDEFWSKYGPGYKGGREAFKAEALEFCLEKQGYSYRKSYEHDSIFRFAPHIIIDWKLMNPIYNSACINYHTANYDSTHYGFFRMNLDDVNIGKLLKFEFVSLVDKRTVFKNKHRSFREKGFFTYRPEKTSLHLEENSV
jgi:hypothetical protein